MFTPDCTNLEKAARNVAAPRLPLYEHIIAPSKIEEILGRSFAAQEEGTYKDKLGFFANFNDFFLRMGYDTVSYECCITEVIEQGQVLSGHRPGPIQDRKDFDEYPFPEIPQRFFSRFDDNFRALGETLPPGMKAVGGVGNGVFEIVQDLVGYSQLCLIAVDDPALYAALFRKVGDLMAEIWTRFLRRHGASFIVARFGDDLGFKSSTLLSRNDILAHIVPQYRRIGDIIHSHGKPFLLHSCGNIFAVMDELIGVAGIDAKHSNEDQIAPFSEWVSRYGSRIGCFGGVDMDVLCRCTTAEIRDYVNNVIDTGLGHGGFAVGSGNSIPAYVPAEGYMAMVETVRRRRGE